MRGDHNARTRYNLRTTRGRGPATTYRAEPSWPKSFVDKMAYDGRARADIQRCSPPMKEGETSVQNTRFATQLSGILGHARAALENLRGEICADFEEPSGGLRRR